MELLPPRLTGWVQHGDDGELWEAPSFQAPVTFAGGAQPEQGKGVGSLENKHSVLMCVTSLQSPTEPLHWPEPNGSREPRATVDLVHRAHPLDQKLVEKAGGWSGGAGRSYWRGNDGGADSRGAKVSPMKHLQNLNTNNNGHNRCIGCVFYGSLF